MPKTVNPEKIPQNPFIVLLNEKGDYLPLHLVNPTDQKYNVRILTGAFSSTTDSYIETSKKISDYPTLQPKSNINIEDIHFTELDFTIWYMIDLIDKDGEVLKRSVSVPRWAPFNERYLNFGINRKTEAIIKKLGTDDRESLEEKIKGMDMGPRTIN